MEARIPLLQLWGSVNVSVILFFVHFGQAFPFLQAVLAALILTALQIGAFAYACFLADLDQRQKEKEEKKRKESL